MNDNKELPTPTELWKPILGYESYYHISNMGRVWALRSQRVLSVKANVIHGYGQVSLSVGGHIKNWRVHKLVALAFIPNPLGLPQINHKDCDKTNNRAQNLEWVTASANTKHAYANGRIGVGEKHVRAKLTNSQVREIRANGMPEKKAAIHYGVSPTAIGDLRRGRTYKSIK